MSGRLDPLCFLPPPVGTPWTGPPRDTASGQITRTDGVEVDIEIPLFWHDPAWHQVGAETADLVATAIAEYGVLVSAMRSDLSGPNREPILHSSHLREGDDSGKVEPALPRIVPYRHERYGFSDLDFDDAKVIDLRLSVGRDASGRLGYSQQQIERWEATPSSQPLAGGSWVAAATFLPDVESVETLSAKLEQLRALSPNAAVMVSVDAFHLESAFDSIMANHPDGLIVRMGEMSLSGLQLAVLTRRARALADKAEVGMPLWVVPGEITADDAAKLIALGANAVAVDAWGKRVLEQVANQATGTRVSSDLIYGLVEDLFEEDFDRAVGLVHSMHHLTPSDRIASLDRSWAKALGIPALPFDTLGDGIE